MERQEQITKVNSLLEKAEGELWLSSTAWNAVRKWTRPRLKTLGDPLRMEVRVDDRESEDHGRLTATLLSGNPGKGPWVDHELNIVEL